MPAVWKKYRSEPSFPTQPVTANRTENALDTARKLIAAAFDEGKREVDLSGLGLVSLPEEIRDLQHFRTLHTSDLHLFLSNNNLQQLPSYLFELSNLSVLSLRGNVLQELPQDVHKLTQLRELQLAGNMLPFLPVEIKKLDKLKTLAISPTTQVSDGANKQPLLLGPMSLKEVTGRAVLKSFTEKELKSYDLPIELNHILSTHRQCSECQGPFFEYFARIVRVENVAGVDVPLAYHLCSTYCCHTVTTSSAHTGASLPTSS